eukprot:TRINITY_DN17317_c0_g1_i1.p1 TRINITY_DN17317_c0_g1~~TRINITY_DN17317_c0_g1_i1.p1  ORF type:complete len:311 (+),score=109.25 TRINITY_DN17317_c0_g1_i1:50-934(+)
MSFATVGLWSRCRRWLRVPRVRPEQDLSIATFVSVMILLYAWLSSGPLAAAAGRTEAWRQRQRLVSAFETVVVLWTLWRAALTDPGQVPIDFSPAPAEEANSVLCRRCDTWKVARTHHCSHCARCVMRYDHHCDWIDNCVGRNNHKFFVLFLWYVNACILHYFYMLVNYLWHWGGDRPGRGGGMMRGALRDDRVPLEAGPAAETSVAALLFGAFLAVYSVLASGLLLFASTFSAWTTHQMFTNQTTFEVDFVVGRPYDRGFLRNTQEVLGRNPVLWLIPCASSEAPAPRRDMHL